MKYRMIKTIVLLTFLFALVPSVTFSALKWRAFVLTVPEEVAATPGQEVIINGTVLNTGWWWLHNFSLTLEDLPSGFEYKITPNHWDDFRITKDWNPQQGVFKIPEPILISIKVPLNAAGLYTVTAKGQENYSPYKFSNTTTFVLKIVGEPKFTISEISVPSIVYENESFNVSVDIKNEGNVETVTNVSLNIPTNWTIDFKNKVDVVEPNSTKKFTFLATPTLSAGALSAYVEFMYGKTIYNVTREGPLVVPQPKAAAPEVFPQIPSITGLFEKYSPVLLTIVAVIIIVIAWILWSMYTMYVKRKQPEKIKKKESEKTTSISPSQTPEIAPATEVAPTTEVKPSTENVA